MKQRMLRLCVFVCLSLCLWGPLHFCVCGACLCVSLYVVVGSAMVLHIKI